MIRTRVYRARQWVRANEVVARRIVLQATVGAALVVAAVGSVQDNIILRQHTTDLNQTVFSVAKANAHTKHDTEEFVHTQNCDVLALFRFTPCPLPPVEPIPKKYR